jgi:hypothetical protein
MEWAGWTAQVLLPVWQWYRGVRHVVEGVHDDFTLLASEHKEPCCSGLAVGVHILMEIEFNCPVNEH